MAKGVKVYRYGKCIIFVKPIDAPTQQKERKEEDKEIEKKKPSASQMS
ncbi:MAG: hypothetical protein HPY74_20510 [Firmicutes bacterium]|nr:hypothetical protein [Bacillota bacterium]